MDGTEQDSTTKWKIYMKSSWAEILEFSGRAKKKSNVERKINSNVDPFLSFTAEAAFLRDFSDVLHLKRKRAGPGSVTSPWLIAFGGSERGSPCSGDHA